MAIPCQQLKTRCADFFIAWGYNYTWGNTWITQHDQFGAEFFKPIIAEEYGADMPHNHTGVEGPWQTTIYNSNIASDSIWQYGTSTGEGLTSWDVNTIWSNDSEYQSLVLDHAKLMKKKKVDKALLH